MPTDLPPDFATSLPAVFSSSAALQQTLAATAAVAVPGRITIKKAENLAKRKGVKSTATHYIIPFNIVPVTNPSTTCFQNNMDVNTPTLPTGFDVKSEWSSEFHSDSVGVVSLPTQSCIVEKSKPNINWKPGAKPVVATITISKKFLTALRDATPTDLVITLSVRGYVAPLPEDDEDK